LAAAALLHQSSGFLLGPQIGRPHKAIMFSQSSEDGAVDAKMEATYVSLVDRLISRYERQSAADELQNNQLFVGIAGGPGSGKSTLASAVAQRINLQLKVDDACIVLPMDGFHYTRAELQSIANSPDNNYTYEDLLARRGAPWTFDAEGCIQKFTEARVNGKASLPIYSRVKSDPVEDGVTLHSETKIVLLEGNYLLSWRDSRWQPLQKKNVFDETWYIACKSLDDQRERLVQRHLETWSEEKTKMWGSGEEGAGAKADANDMLNLVWIEEMSKGFESLTIESI
jgi:pantothenate kinase